MQPHRLADRTAQVGQPAAARAGPCAGYGAAAGASCIVRRIRRSAASSSGVQAAKLLRLTVGGPGGGVPELGLLLLLLLAEPLGLGRLERRQRLRAGDRP